MYYDSMENFIVIAETGSFEKAAKSLFLSSTALIKQVNQLEESLHIKLFDRTNKGLVLTAGGKVIYEAVRNTQNYLASSVLAAQNANAEEKRIIRMGISLLNPYHDFTVGFRYDQLNCTDFILSVTPLGNEQNAFYGHVNNLGNRVDIIPYFLGNRHLEGNCNTFCLAKIPLCLMIPITHPLCGQKKVSFEDLNGSKVVTLSDKNNVHYEKFNEMLRQKAPDAQIYYVDLFDYVTFNFALIRNAVLLVGSFLKNAFPMAVMHELDERLMLPYGLLYSKVPSGDVQAMLDNFRSAGYSGNEEDAKLVKFR